MYSTKSIHKNINPNYPQGYTSIGDPYKTSLEKLPTRWKEKQFVTQRCPQNASNGFFTKLQYQPEQYTELAENFRTSQPLDKRNLGFGSRDAFKPGEFTNTKATERYRDMVKNESKLLRRNQNGSRLSDEAIEKVQSFSETRQPPKDKLGNALQEPKFLYDIGRSNVTPYTPNNTHDSFYSLPKHAPVNPKLKGVDPIRRLGSHKPMSTTIGEQAWAVKYGKPAFGAVNCVKKFYDRGHIECKGF